MAAISLGQPLACYPGEPGYISPSKAGCGIRSG
jgi:hypothetical protein